VSELDDYLRLLADERNRRLLRSLDESDDPVSTASDDPQVRARLHHVHLPKLVEAGLVDWDPRNDVIVRGPAFDEIVPLLEAVDDFETDDGD
jgi:hypothetical protein